MILFGIILSFLIFLGYKNPNMGLLTKDKVQVLKPFLAIAIVLHHLHNETSYLHEFERWGPLVVGIFYFFSGYGLSYSQRKVSCYLDNFFFKKIIVKLFIPYIFAFLLFGSLTTGLSAYDIKEHITNPTGPWLFPNDWFLIALVYNYVIFMIASKFKSNVVRLGILVVGPLLLVLFASSVGWARNWWATPMAFSIGAVYEAIEDDIVKLSGSRKNFLYINLFCLLFFSVVILMSSIYGSAITAILAYSLLPLWVIYCLVHIEMTTLAQNRAILFVGGISFEIYLIHGIVIALLRDNTSLCGIPLVASALMSSVIAALMFKYITHTFIKFLSHLMPSRIFLRQNG